MEDTLFGLYNIGNTCFMNSVLQLMSSSTDFIKEVENGIEGIQPGKQQLFKIIFSERGLPSAGRDICTLFRGYYEKDEESYYKGQHVDASEFLGYFIDKWNIKSFQIVPRITVTRLDNGEKSHPQGTENVLKLSMTNLNGERNTNFNQCISSYTHYKPTDYQVIDLEFVNIGNQIIIELNRFTTIFENGEISMKKNKRPVHMDQLITLTISGEPVEFRMKSVIMHIGELNGGHYISFKRVGDTWYSIDDSSVKVYEEENFNYGYVFLYERVIEI